MRRNRILKEVLILAILSISIIFGACGSKKDNQLNNSGSDQGKKEVDEENKENSENKNDTDSSGSAESKENNENNENNENIDNKVIISNNGGLYVYYKDTVYYREYTKDSYAPVGILGGYEANPASVKNMIAMKDGEKRVAFTDTGEGPIFIYKDRMYLKRYNEEMMPVLYSLDLDGDQEHIIGNGWIEFFDGDRGIFVCILADENNAYQLYQVNGDTGNIKKYDLENSCGEVLAVKDGVIYYQGMVETDQAIKGAVRLCRVDLDGSNERVLTETKADLYEYGDLGAVIPTIQFMDDDIYFAYGAYGGTGHFYQGGNIVRVKKDGSNLMVLVGNGEAGPYANDVFYVAKEGDKHILYYSEISEELSNYKLDVNFGYVEGTDFIPHEADTPFEYEDGVWIYLNGSSAMTELIPHIDYSTLGVDGDYYSIEDIQLCDSRIYYKIQASKEEPDFSIGWRTGYRRLKTQVISQEPGGANKEILFEY